MKKGYKIYKQYTGVNLIQNGFNSYSTKGNTQLGKLIKEAQAVLKNCVVWYEIVNLESGTVNIIYKEVWNNYFIEESEVIKMARLKTVYILSIDNFGQPSGDITEVKMTKEEYLKRKQNDEYIYDKYSTALYVALR